VKTFACRVEDGLYSVEAVLTLCGQDAAAAICGGTGPHIGAAALAVSRPSLEGCGKTSASASVLCLTGHKDDSLARQAALELSSLWGCTVLVSVGIHIDGADDAAIARLEENFTKLLQKLKETVIL
jgi:hypothetical protein